MRLRNDFMYYLVLNIQSGELKPPFTEKPAAGRLPMLAQVLPGGPEALSDLEGAGKWAEGDLQSKEGKPVLQQRSPDGGAFLAAQPIPRCGAFCYLAVVSKSPKTDE